MNRVPVYSSSIRSAGYDPQAGVLEVEFNSGNIYRYSGVTETIYQNLLCAPSKGSYFHNYIKGMYPSIQVR